LTWRPAANWTTIQREGEIIMVDNPPCNHCKWLKAEIRVLKEKANFTCDEVIVLARYVADLNRRIGHTKNYINDTQNLDSNSDKHSL